MEQITDRFTVKERKNQIAKILAYPDNGDPAASILALVGEIADMAYTSGQNNSYPTMDGGSLTTVRALEVGLRVLPRKFFLKDKGLIP